MGDKRKRREQAGRIRRLAEVVEGGDEGALEAIEMMQRVLDAAARSAATMLVYRVVGGLEAGEVFDFERASQLGDECMRVAKENAKHIGADVAAGIDAGDGSVVLAVRMPAEWEPFVARGAAIYGVTGLVPADGGRYTQ